MSVIFTDFNQSRTDRKCSVNIASINLYGSWVIRSRVVSCVLRQTDGRSEFNRRYAGLQLRLLFHLLLSRLVKQEPAPLLKIDLTCTAQISCLVHDGSSYRFEEILIFRYKTFRLGFLFHVFLLNTSVSDTHSFTSNAPSNITPIKHLDNLVRPVLKFVLLYKVLKYHNSVLMNSYYFLTF
jgi:hypothetical protein